jgi:hypothetical protein
MFRQSNGRGFRVFEFKVHRHPLRVGLSVRRSIVMIVILFHIVGDSFGGLIINVEKSVIFNNLNEKA